MHGVAYFSNTDYYYDYCVQIFIMVEYAWCTFLICMDYYYDPVNPTVLVYRNNTTLVK